MGSLELHAERRVQGTWTYVGAFSLEKDYGLFHVLGTPGLGKFAVLPHGKRAKQIGTVDGLPADPSDELREIAYAREEHDEGSWRNVTRELLVSYDWDQQVVARFLAGPVGFTSYREGVVSARWIEDTPERRAYLAKIGTRIVSQVELAAFLDADAGRFVASDPFEQRARVVTELAWATTVAGHFRFQAALDWMSGLGAESVRIAVWTEI